MKPVTTSLLVRAVCAALALAVPACSGGGGRSSAAVASRNGDGTPAVRIIVGGLDKQIYLPVTLARELGYYQAQGLDVRFHDEPNGVEAETAMISGQVDAVVGFYDHTVDLRSKGRSTESVVQLLRAPGEVEMVRTDEAGSVKSPADFGGKHLGVTGLGSSTNFLTQYLEAKNGVKAGSATSVAVGAGSTFVAAMRNKQIDAGMTTEPTVSLLERKKLAQPLIDLRTPAGAKATLGGTYPASCLYLTTKYVRKNPEVVQKLVNVYVETLKWIQAHSAAEIADKMPAAYYAGVGKAVYTKALQNEKGMYSPDGLMPADGPRTVYKVLATFDPTVKGHSVDLSQTYTNDFVNKAR
ncbi:ABC transporter substrate-binding protein [Streptomyces mirabilis]|uniref:ABC transporter substrate-binding protein n=1 Tax=Streptomyces mirabilis TaxID=68239 RepID=UPI0022CD1A8A|nr:ABC transporter substrate-binding protein [Streptomyces mirabilis]